MRPPRVLLSFLPLMGVPLAIAAPALARGDAFTMPLLGQIVVAGIAAFALWAGIAEGRD